MPVATKNLRKLINSVSALYGVSIELDGAVSTWLVSQISIDSAGSRIVQQVMDNQVAGPLALFLSQTPAPLGNRVRVSVVQDTVRV